MTRPDFERKEECKVRNLTVDLKGNPREDSQENALRVFTVSRDPADPGKMPGSEVRLDGACVAM